MKSKNRKKNIPVQDTSKEIQSQEELAAEIVDWQGKLQYHRYLLITIGIAILAIVVISSIYLTLIKSRAEESWLVLGEVLQTLENEELLHPDFFQLKPSMAQQIPPNVSYRDEVAPPNFKVKDLTEKGRKFLENAIGDVNGLPEDAISTKSQEEKEPEIGKPATPNLTLEQIQIRYFPSKLAHQAILLHNIERLEQQASRARNTSVAPWIYACLAHLYSWENSAKALEYYNTLQKNYPDFVLNSSTMTIPGMPTPIDQARHYIQQDVEWSQKHPLSPKFEFSQSKEGAVAQAIFTTNRGKIKTTLLVKDFPITTDHFISLVKSGFYNGLNFYQIGRDRVWSGCPIGNGKGGNDRTGQGEIKDVWPRRGLLVMDNYDKPGKIGTRFFIIKKFAVFPDPHSLVGIITEGMDIVDSLTEDDLLLDVTISNK